MRIPVATYRLQFNAEFRFEDARRLVPYLDAMGITDVYASPLLRARRGSPHGYDVTDPTRLNPDVGTPRQFDRLGEALGRRGMGLLLDIVPNHMAMSSENPWWMDVLENGPGSRYAAFFDIDWKSPILEGRILVPILGSPYAQVLDRGELTPAIEERGLVLRYADQVMPVDPATWGPFLAHDLDRWTAEAGRSHPSVRKMRALLDAVQGIPARTDPDPGSRDRRARAAASAKRRLWRLYSRDPDARRSLEAALRAYGGRRRRPQGEQPAGDEAVDLLDRLVGVQAYLLAYWRTAPEEVDYRRFFDIADLIALRTQEREVFDATHALVLRLFDEGKVTGFRADHVDGLHDPLGYLWRLQIRLDEGFVVVEKILEAGERLPRRWPVAGTTGYEFMAWTSDLFVDAEGLERLTSWWRSVTGVDASYDGLVMEQKRKVMDELFRGEVTSLGHRLRRLALNDRRGRDITASELHAALVEVTAALPVYRTYIRSLHVSKQDRGHIETALRAAGRRGASDAELGRALEFLREVLTLDLPPGRPAEVARSWLAFVMRWQLLTGAVMAKGLEDTLLYVFTPLVARNEVGSSPGSPPPSVEEFHRRIRARGRAWPHALNASSTHDAKRGEDVRARLAALSEITGTWTESVDRWRTMNAMHRRAVSGVEAPDAAEEILLYQTLVGVWPPDADGMGDLVERVRDYMRKALREARVHTSWIDPVPAYEEAVDAFVRRVLARGNAPFLEDLGAFASTIAWYGALNSLAQVVLKICSPGIPDFYQGSELWDLTLVDPDNRCGVDFARRRAMLRDIDRPGVDPAALLRSWEDGAVKLWVTSRALRFRRSNRDLFLDGTSTSLRASGGPASEHTVAFARRRGDRWAVAVVPRLITGLADPGEPPVGPEVWGQAAIPLPAAAPDRWVNALTGDEVEARTRRGRRVLRLADALTTFPVAILGGGSAAGSGAG